VEIALHKNEINMYKSRRIVIKSSSYWKMSRNLTYSPSQARAYEFMLKYGLHCIGSIIELIT